MRDSLEVIAPALGAALVGVDGGVPRRARQGREGGHFHMLLVIVLHTQAKVDQVQVVDLASDPPHEVFRLDVAVHDAFRVQVLDAVQNLAGYRSSGSWLEPERACLAALLHAILQRLPEELHDHHVPLPVELAVMVDLGEAVSLEGPSEFVQQLRFILQTRGASLLELDRYLGVRLSVHASEHLPEGSLAEFLVHLPAVRDALGHLSDHGWNSRSASSNYLAWPRPSWEDAKPGKAITSPTA
mmetsp:Transcript_83809/g.242044  ORF Transcript_83809/g.242044 Transcript_83809/m.242044 type:complete len:242 (-) Transcript_83809:7-732(-)